jgi:cellulose synthase operon protein C
MKTRRTINYVAVLVLLVSAGLLGAGIHFLHRFQIERNAHVLLEQADQAEQQGQDEQAVNFLIQYLGMAPNDTEVLARYGLLRDKLAKTPKQRLAAFFVLEKALRLGVERPDVRRHVASLAIDLKLFSDARHHLEILLKGAGEDADLLILQARCETGELKFSKAREFYAKAVIKKPSQVEGSLEYAELLRRRLDDPKEADEVVESLLMVSPRSLPARLAAAHYYARWGLWERAEAAVQMALEDLGAKEVDTFLLAAEVAEARRNPKQAREYLEQGLKEHPAQSRLGQGLARLELRAGRTAEAWDKVKAAAKTLPTEPEELWSFGNLLVDLEKMDEADEVVKRLTAANQKWAADALRARLRMRQGAWGEALALLESVRASRPPTPSAVGRVELLLAVCYQRLSNPDQQLRAARRALESNPSPAARLVVASALAALGKIDEAIREYSVLAEETPEVRGQLARLLLLKNRRLAPAARQWEQLEQLLKQLPADMASQQLRAEMLTARGQAAEARALMDAERQRDPKQLTPWLFLIAQAEREDDGKAVLPLLDEAERATGRRIEWTVARVNHAVRTAPEKADDELKKLEANLKVFQGAERDQLLRALGAAFLATGDVAAAARLWDELAESQPGDLDVRFQRLELAYGKGDGKRLEQLVAEVRRLEGADGVVTRYGEAARLLLQARGGDKKGLTEARRNLREAESLRPSWSAIPLLEAEVFELEGRTDKALEKYQAALDRGESRLMVVRRVLDLLAAQGRFADAQALLNRLPERAQTVGGLDRLGAQLALFNPDSANTAEGRRHALESARKAIPADSKNYRDHLWLGQMCLLAEDKIKAEEAFRRARDLADTDPNVWAILILFLAQTDAKKVETELAAAKAKLPAAVLPRVLAPGYEVLGQLEKAEKEYLNEASASADNAAGLYNVANFYTRTGQMDKAEPFLRKLMDPRLKAAEATVGWARHTLALILAVRGNYRQFQEAQSLVKERRDETLEDSKMRALVLATRPQHQRAALRLFEALSPGLGTVTPDVKYMLAQLYEVDGKWDLAKRYLLSLLEDEKKNPSFHAYYVRALLRHKEAEEAQGAVERLAKLDGSPLEKLELRARVLHANHKSDAAVKLLQAYSREKDARLDVAATLLDEFGETSLAQQLFRAYASASDDPLRGLLLAQHLGRHGKLAAALEVCERAWDKCPAESAAGVSVAHACVALLNSSEATEEQRQRVEQRVKAAIQKQPKLRGYTLLLAELEDGRGRHKEAAAIYQQVLTQEPRNVLALNNLAYLLVKTGGDSGEALKLIETAIDEIGPNAELLDTRAVIYLQREQPDPALRDLQQALTVTSSPSLYFHLAQAYQMAEDLEKAKEAFAKAKELGIQSATLYVLERKAFNRMRTDFE